MSNFKAISIDGDEFFIVEGWASKLACFVCGYNIYQLPVDSCYREVTSWLKKHVLLSENRDLFYSWYTEGLYTHGDDGIVRFLSDVPVKNRHKVKRKNYGVEASVIIETSEPIPTFVIDNLESIVVYFMKNFKYWAQSDIPPFNLRQIKFGENNLEVSYRK